jgi:hypothetical protein
LSVPGSVWPRPAASGDIVESDYEQVPFTKAFNSTFADDYAGKKVRVKGIYSSIFDNVLDLPPEYKNGYIRFLIQSIDLSDTSTALVIPKAASESVFSLAGRTEIEVFGTFILTTIRYGITGQSQKRLLLVVDKVVPVKKEAAASSSSDSAIPEGAYVKKGDKKVYIVLGDDGTFQQWGPRGQIDGTYIIEGDKITWMLADGRSSTDDYFGDYINNPRTGATYQKTDSQGQAPARKQVVSANCPAPGTKVAFAKVINPAFAKDYAGCSIITRAKFGASGADVSAAAVTSKATKENKVVFRLLAPGSTSVESGAIHVLIGKSRSDLVFELSEGDRIDLTGGTRFLSGTDTEPVFEAKKIRLVK